MRPFKSQVKFGSELKIQTSLALSMLNGITVCYIVSNFIGIRNADRETETKKTEKKWKTIDERKLIEMLLNQS